LESGVEATLKNFAVEVIWPMPGESTPVKKLRLGA